MKKSKKCIVFGTLASLTAVVLFASVSGGKTVLAGEEADGSVKINETNFPDPVVREKVKTYDRDNNGSLSKSERSVSTLSWSRSSIENPAGIEYFPNLTRLDIDSNKITSIDLSKNTKLETVYIKSNKLESINVTGLTYLRLLSAEYNQLQQIDLSTNTKLSELRLGSNPLTSLNLSKNNALQELLLDRTCLTSLDLSNNTNLKEVNCSGESYAASTNPKISTLTLGNLPKLQTLSCNYNAISKLDVSGCTGLKSLSCTNNQLTQLNVSKCTALESLLCSKNQLTKLSVPSNSELTRLECSSNRLTSLNVSGMLSLTSLSCDLNPILSLDVTKNTQLVSLYCGGNYATPENERLTTLTLTGASALTSLTCDCANISALDISTSPDLISVSIAGVKKLSDLDCSGLTKLTRFDGSSTKLTSLNLSNLPQLKKLDLNDAEITNVNLSGATALTEFELSANYYDTKLSNVNLSGCTALEEVFAFRCGIKTLNVSGDTALKKISCSENEIKTLTLTNCSSLEKLDCAGNYISKLTLSSASNLVELDCVGNNLSSLDVSKNKELMRLECYGNPIATLDLSNTPFLNECMSNLSNGTIGTSYHDKQCKGYRYSVSSNQYVHVDINTNVISPNLTPTPKPSPTNTPTPTPSEVVSIDAAHFPDSTFRTLILDSVDKDKDKSLDTQEIANTTSLSPYGNVTTLKGVEYLTGLEKLYCDSLALSELDVSKLTKLTYLDCSDNRIKTLDLSKNTKLQTLNCYNNVLSSLTLNCASSLESLKCYGNQISTLTISSYSKLKVLACDQNAITSINLNGCTKLLNLVKTTSRRATGTGYEMAPDRVAPSYSYGKEGETECFLSFDRYVDIVSSSLTPTPTPPAPAADSVAVNSTNFPDAAFRQYIKEVDMDENRNGALEKSEIAKVKELEVQSRGINSLKGMEYFSNLTFLNCVKNQLSALDLSANTKLCWMLCYDNSINELNLFFCPTLARAYTDGENWEEDGVNGYWLDTKDEAGNPCCYYVLTDSSTIITMSKPTVGKPSNEKAEAASATRVNVSWSAVNGATGYQVWRSTSATSDFKAVGSVSTTNRVCTGLTAGTTYYFKVRAYKEVNGTKYYGAYSSVVSATPLAVPAGVKAASASATSVKVSWNAASGVTGYQVWRGTSATGTFTALGSVTTTSRTCTGLTTGTTYYFKVRAYKEVNGTKYYGAFSSVVNAVPKVAAPSGVKATTVSTGSIEVSWNAVSGATGYQVCRATSATGTFTAVGSVTTTSRVCPGLSAGTTYYFKIRAYKEVNGTRYYGNYSSVISGVTKPAAPGNAKAAVASATKVNVSWSAVTGATGYEVWRSESANGTFTKLGAVTTTNRACPGLTTGKTYYFKVRAYIEVNGEKIYGAYSTVVSATPKA